MRLLICGMHRSGHSALAHLLCRATGMSLYDDPLWAQWAPSRVLSNAEIGRELEAVDVLKCPRMAGYLDQVLASNSQVKVVWMHRDLRDILASILERVKNSPGTTLLKFGEIEVEEEGIEALCAAAKIYADVLARCLVRFPRRLMIVKYEEFFAAKETTIARVAQWVDTSMDVSKIGKSLDEQFGPERHKFEGIRGPGRWITDLNSAEIGQLGEATEAWNGILARDSETLNKIS